MKQLERWSTFAIILLMSLYGLVPRAASVDMESTPTVSASVSQSSLFDDDTCSPPCWFGLTPGKSTTDNVIEMFQAHRDLFLVNPEPGPALDLTAENFDALFRGKSPTFLWKSWDKPGMAESRIQITDGVVTSIDVVMNQVISLQDTLDILGQPAYVLGVADLGITLSLFYTDKNIVVNLDGDIENCNIETFVTDLAVFSLYYYSPQVFEAVQDTYIGYSVVSPETWRQWQTQPDELSCAHAIGQQTDLFAGLVLTPTSLITSTATPSR